MSIIRGWSKPVPMAVLLLALHLGACTSPAGQQTAETVEPNARETREDDQAALGGVCELLTTSEVAAATGFNKETLETRPAELEGGAECRYIDRDVFVVSVFRKDTGMAEYDTRAANFSGNVEAISLEGADKATFHADARVVAVVNGSTYFQVSMGGRVLNLRSAGLELAGKVLTRV